MEQFNKQKGAISLAEILVVVAIIGILATVMLINYPAVKKQLALQRAATKLAQDIRRAQEMAIASEPCPAGMACAGQIPETGYGIYINEDNEGYYLLYADTGGDQKSKDGADATVQIDLEKEIIIYDIPNSQPDKVSINFSPPDPEITIKWQSGDSQQDSVSVVLCIKDSNCSVSANTKTVYVNKAGLITVQ